MLADPATGRATIRAPRRAALRPRLQPQRPLPLLLAGAGGRRRGRPAARQPGRRPVPLPLLSQYLPRQHDAFRAGSLTADPRALVRAKIDEVAAVMRAPAVSGQQ